MPARRNARGLVGLAALAALLLSAPPTAVAGDGAEETLRNLYRIAISAEMCEFALSPRQSDALGRAMDRSLAESGLDEDAADALYRGVDAALNAEGWDKVCAQNGDWARTYRALVAANVK